MKKSFKYILIVFGVLLLLSYLVMNYDSIANVFGLKKSNTLKPNISTPVLAEFSFKSEIPSKKIDLFRHFTIELNRNTEWKIEKEALAQIPETIPIMLTVETWIRRTVFNYYMPLSDIIEGNYDKILQKMCTELIGNRPNVYIRFNPEMEVPVDLYPWQNVGYYVASFQHLSQLCKTYSPQSKIVWAPAGYPGAMEYYPGDSFVDATTVTLKSDSEVFLNVYPKNYPVGYDVMRRLHRLRFIDKPIYVLGSKQSSNDSVNDQVLTELSMHINENRDVIYSTHNFQRFDREIELDKPRDIEIGLYDPQGLLNKEKPVTVEHLFADFSNLTDGSFETSFKQIENRGHDIIVSLEPFRITNGEKDQDVLQNVLKGIYDEEISHLYAILLSTKRNVYLRYAHEMEIPITRYPWQSHDPVEYIKSFRYFMTFNDSLPSNIMRVWGPAGDRGSIEWWPGDDVVDFISIAIYGLPDKNITDPTKQETFETIFNRKYWRMRFLNKPIFITEFGVKGPEDFQTKW
jgi:beta-mannanase